MKYTMNLKDHPFHMIQSGQKNIEIRLYDEKRQQLSVWDTITFTNESLWVITKKIIWLSVYDSFATMFAVHQLSCFGGDSIEEITERLYTYYTPEDEKKHGVCAIVLE